MSDTDAHIAGLAKAFLALTARGADIEDRLSRLTDPTWEVGPEVEVVSDSERKKSLPLGHWIDGIVGYAELAGEIQGFASNGPTSARWAVDPRGRYLDEVKGNLVDFDANAGIYNDVKYASGGPIYHDERNGRLIKVYHGERYPDGSPSRHNFWSFLGLAVADDSRPDTWRDMGVVIAPERPFVEDGNSPAEITGGPFLITDGDDLLIYFKDTDKNGLWKGLGVASCPLATVLAAAGDPDPLDPPRFLKRHQGAWTQPGIAGRSDDLLPGCWFWWFDIHYLVDHELYCLVTSVPEASGMALWIRIGTDPVSWGFAQRLTDPQPAQILYPSITGPGILPLRRTAGNELVVTYVRSASGWPNVEDRWTDASICQRTLTIGPQAPAPIGDPEGWIDVPDVRLLNGWTRAGFPTPPAGPLVRYRKHAGTLYVEVPAITGGSNGEPIFFLPAGYRVGSEPFSDEQTMVFVMDSSTGSFGAGAVKVEQDGGVVPYFPPGFDIVLDATCICRLPHS
jgi:hypothetical protein